MRKAVPVTIDSEQETQLLRLTRSGASPQRLVERAMVVLLASEGKTNEQIADALGLTRQKAGRWRDRFATDGMAGILEDKPSRGRKLVITAKQREAVVRRTIEEVPAGQTHWSTRTMAEASGLGGNYRPGDLEKPWSEAPFGPHLQGIQRSKFREQARGHRGSLPQCSRTRLGSELR